MENDDNNLELLRSLYVSADNEVAGSEINKNLHFVKMHELLRLQVLKSGLKESTIRNRMTTARLLERYFPDLLYRNMSIAELGKIVGVLKGMKFAANTVTKHVNHIKICVNWASMIPGNNIRVNIQGFRSQSTPSKITFLTEDELIKIELYSTETDANNRYNACYHCANAFLFCCYTGLRYSDFHNLKSTDIDCRSKEKWLTLFSQKTGKFIRIPLTYSFGGKALALLDLYADSLDRFFDVPSNALVDKYLGKIAAHLEITRHFSFHSARHTNATLLLNKGVSVTTVQKLLGHSSVGTTMRYCEVLEDTIIKELRDMT